MHSYVAVSCWLSDFRQRERVIVAHLPLQLTASREMTDGRDSSGCIGGALIVWPLPRTSAGFLLFPALLDSPTSLPLER